MKFKSALTKLLLLVAFLVISSSSLLAQRQMEKLDRGLIAMRQGADSVYVGWRLLGTEPDEIAFNLYRKTGEKPAIKLNNQPIIQSTNFIDTKVDFSFANTYFVKAVIKGVEQFASKSYVLPVNVLSKQYL
ncbi:MAG: hypothetical protein EOO42_22330, partial [Flavobacteriales bacterium]